MIALIYVALWLTCGCVYSALVDVAARGWRTVLKGGPHNSNLQMSNVLIVLWPFFLAGDIGKLLTRPFRGVRR